MYEPERFNIQNVAYSILIRCIYPLPLELASSIQALHSIIIDKKNWESWPLSNYVNTSESELLDAHKINSLYFPLSKTLVVLKVETIHLLIFPFPLTAIITEFYTFIGKINQLIH